MSGQCYPDRLISQTPNIYYYAANNPSEATIAKRRSYASTVSYLTPPAGALCTVYRRCVLLLLCCTCIPTLLSVSALTSTLSPTITKA